MPFDVSTAKRASSEPIKKGFDISTATRMPQKDSPSEEWDAYYKKTVTPKTVNPDNLDTEVVAPIKHAASARAYDIPKAALVLTAKKLGLNPQEMLSKEYPEQKTLVGKALRLGLTIPAYLTGKWATDLASGTEKLARAAGTVGSKFVPKAAKPLTAVAGSAVRVGAGAGAATLPYAPATAITQSPETAKEQVDFNAKIGAAAGAIGPIGRAAGKFVSNVGRNVQDITLGKGTADRGREVGFKKILSPEYNAKDVPQFITQKAVGMFKGASNATGAMVSNAVNSNRLKNVKVDTFQLQDEVGKLLPNGVTLDDLDITPAQKKTFQKFIDTFMARGKVPYNVKGRSAEKILAQNKMSLPELWKLRLDLDRLSKDTNFTTKTDAVMLRDRMREILNRPLVEQKHIAKQFKKYAFVKNAEEMVGGFSGIKDPKKKAIYSPEVETFVNSVISGKSKGEKINILQAVEKYLPEDERVVDDIINYAAAKNIRTPSSGLSIQNLIGKERVANLSTKVQGASSKVGEIAKTPLGQALSMPFREELMGDDEAKAVLRKLPRPGLSIEDVSNPNTAPKAGAGKSAPVDSLGFYSKLEEVVTNKMSGTMPKEQLLKMLKNNGVKDEEIEWVLKDLPEKPTKQQVMESINQNKVQVGEKVLGKEERRDLRMKEVRPFVWNIVDEQGNVVAGDMSQDNASQFIQNMHGGEGRTKFSQYQLPGGSNYRERLLTLPEGSSNVEQLAKEKYDAKLRFLKEFEKDSGLRRDQVIEISKGIDTGDISSSNLNLIKQSMGQEKAYRFIDEMRTLAMKHDEAFNRRKEGRFRSSHFDEPNILAHTRQSDRIDIDGKKGVLLEEVQSDWHQKGRDAGYQGQGEKYKTLPEGYRVNKEISVENGKEYPKYWITDPNGNIFTSRDYSEKSAISQALNRLNDADRGTTASPVPNAPFKKTWHELALKKSIMDAVKRGDDRIYWTTGETQAERYDLSKQVDAISYLKKDDGKILIEVKRPGQKVYDNMGAFEPSKLDDVVGKDLAKKIIESNKDTDDFTGLDLKVGGEGMKGFYDQIIPAYMKKYGKVGKTQIVTKRNEVKVANTGSGYEVFVGGESRGNFMTKAEALRESKRYSANNESKEVWYLDITPELKQKAKSGLPLFQMTAATGGALALSSTQAEASEKQKKTLGMLNNNPINLKAFEKWDGMTGKDKHGHAQFESLDHGIRASIKNLRTHQKRHPTQTLVQYLKTFAEANSMEEAKYIAKKMDITINTQLRKIDMDKMLIHLAQFESKIKLTPEDISRVKKQFNLG